MCEPLHLTPILTLWLYTRCSSGSVVVDCTLSLRAPVEKDVLKTILKEAIRDKKLLVDNELSIPEGKAA
jgi:hypothetical protein